MNQHSPKILKHIQQLFAERGESMYAGEPVTQTQHALQCAWQAEQANAGDALITAALLHDVGHLLHDLPENCAEGGVDDRHEQLGARWLQQSFGADVCEPVKLHVPAKRYRCRVDSDYRERLSPASVLSLRLQGGPMSVQEAAAFEQNEYFEHALRLRSWDESAKTPGLDVPPLIHFLKYVEKSLP